MKTRAILLALAVAACGARVAPDAEAQAQPPSSGAAAAISLALPIACRPGQDCFIQNYVDRDPGPANLDYRCGAETYPGHDGVDIRLPSLAAMRAGVTVVAAAGGVVRGARDGVADVSTRDAGRASVQGHECGNGVAIVHAGGWETQYCHMRQGSIRVRVGQTVAAGEPLGYVGLSGDTEFPHLHLTVRHDGAAVDPFAFGAAARGCGRGQSLFGAAARAALSYQAGEVINVGFAGGPVTEAQVDAAEPLPAGRAAPLVLYVRAINLSAGDVQTLAIIAPDGREMFRRDLPALDRAKATWFAFGGERPPGGAWPAGVYHGRYTVTREGRAVIDRQIDVSL